MKKTILSISFTLSILLLCANASGQANTCATANNAGVVSGTTCAGAGFNQSVNNNGNLSVAQRTTALQGATGCGVTAQDTHWEAFTASSNSTTIEWNGISNCGRITVFSGSCGSLTEIGCDNGAAAANLSVTVATVATNIYYIRIQRCNNNNVSGNMCIYDSSVGATHNIGDGDLNACTGTIYDAGGTGNYTNNETITETYCSDAGNCIEIAFNSFSTEGCCDFLNIYDGPTTGSTLIGTYSGTTSPGTITSSTGCITFEWDSDVSNVSTGWDATISCVACPVPTCFDGIQNQGETGIDCGGPCVAVCPTVYTMDNTSVTTCTGVFYDSGGSGSDYSSSETFTKTFTPDAPCSYLEFVFTSFTIETCCDNLTIYDGPNAASPLIGVYTTNPGTITATNPTGQLTFVWSSDGSVVDAGWVANISCVAGSACSGTPNAGTATATNTALDCSTTSTDLSATGLTTDCDITYQWQSAPAPGGPWTNIAGATNTTYTDSPTSDTYYRIVTTCANGSASNTSSNILITSSLTTPPNDDCSGAISLTMTSDGSCNSVSSSVDCASNSGVAAACFGTPNDDVWFSFVATNDTVYINRVADFDSEVEIFDGCGGTSLGCADAEGTYEVIGLTVGNTYYIRVYSYTSGSPGAGFTDFTICVFGPVPPPDNDLCTDQDPICSDSPTSFMANSGGTDAETVEPANDYGCLSVAEFATSPNPTWYYLEISVAGTVAIDITASDDVDFAFWGPFSDLATAQAGCGSLPYPIDCSYSASATEQANTTASAGDVYILLVTNYADEPQVINLTSAASNTATTDCTILPVDLLSFTGKPKNNGNELTWVTTTEINNDFFSVESSANAADFSEIARVDGSGNSNTRLTYHYIDNDLESNTTYYRLKQVDFDGQYEYSNIIAINTNEKPVINLYPNPSKENLFFNLNNSLNDVYTITYTNVLGSITKEQIDIEEGRNTYQVNEFNSLTPGIYFVQIRDGKGDNIKTQKIIKE